MFCGKCGAQNADNAEFCTNCGAKLKKSSSEKKVLTVPNQNDKNKKIGIIAVSVIAIIIAIIIAVIGSVLLGGRSYKSTIDKYVDASFDANGEALLDLFPDKMLDRALAENNYDSDDLKGVIEDINEQLQDQMDALDNYLGEGWKISYEITADEDVKGDELDDIKSAYEDVDIKVSAAKNIEVEISVKGDETESITLDVSLIKSGRSWYLDIMSMGSLF